MLTYLCLPLISLAWLASAAIDFSDFNTCPQSFLKQYVPAGCDFGSGSQDAIIADWQCLCTTESFLEQSAQGIWQVCGCQDLESTANTIASYCTTVETPINGADSYVEVGDGNIFPCVEPSSPGGSNLSTGDIVGIVAGVVGLIGLGIAFLQLAVTLAWIDPKYEPWPQFVKICCCGTIQVKKKKTRRTIEEEEEKEAQRQRDLELNAGPAYFGRT